MSTKERFIIVLHVGDCIIKVLKQVIGLSHYTAAPAGKGAIKIL